MLIIISFLGILGKFKVFVELIICLEYLNFGILIGVELVVRIVFLNV